jgi:uncharacterized protein (DUF1778 family)
MSADDRSRSERKSERLVIRLSPSQRATILAAARLDDLEEATWARRVLLQAARKVMPKDE